MIAIPKELRQAVQESENNLVYLKATLSIP